MRAKCYDKSFKYTPVAEQGENYLKRKFDAMRRAQKKPEPICANVTALPKARAK